MDGSPAASVLEAPERILRECDCPPWVERCVHHDGLVLALSNGGHTAFHDAHSVGLPQIEVDLWSSTGTAPCNYPNCDDRTFSSVSHLVDEFYVGDDADAALQAFYEAEAALLGRGGDA